LTETPGEPALVVRKKRKQEKTEGIETGGKKMQGANQAGQNATRRDQKMTRLGVLEGLSPRNQRAKTSKRVKRGAAGGDARSKRRMGQPRGNARKILPIVMSKKK